MPSLYFFQTLLADYAQASCGTFGNDRTRVLTRPWPSRLPQATLRSHFLTERAMSLQSICVFCGASTGANPVYREAAIAMGQRLAANGTRLVYGGGAVGLMGVVADAALAAGGEVIGIIPQSLKDSEIGHSGLTRLEVVDGMHARKARMAELSDGFIAMPGGLGTLEELFEIWTWAQLGYHRKPLGLLDVNGFYSKLSLFLDHLVAEEFVKPKFRNMLQRSDSPDALLKQLNEWQPELSSRWQK